jgi:thiamine-phosphate pyrophosphorylase
MSLLKLPKLYAILDIELATKRSSKTTDPNPIATAEALLRGGVKLLQYRHKGEFARHHWEECFALARLTHEYGALFIVNDRVDVALMSGADGVHLGQDDLPAVAARKLMGPSKIIGISTHHPAQTSAANSEPVDYVAIGPVFATTTKANPDPEVGLNGVSAARRETEKPLVAIGGIRRDNAISVLGAGADSLAVVRDLLSAADVETAAREFLALPQ